MTKGFILCDKGFEKTVLEDTQRLLDKELSATVIERGFYFETDNLLDFVTIAYKSQSALRLIIPFCTLKRTPELDENWEAVVEAVKTNTSIDEVKKWVDQEHTFKVDVSDITKKYDSQKIAQKLGAHIFTNADAKADMKYPTTKLALIATETEIMFGVDFSHTLLSKREYKMFNTPTALRATIAYNLLCHSGVIDDIAEIPDDEKLVILDPFTGSGTIPIEAALFKQNMSPRFYQTEELGFWKFKPFTKEQIESHLETIRTASEPKKNVSVLGFDIQTKAVDSTKKNAKIAGVNKAIKLSRVEIDWVDTKFTEEGYVDYIVTVPPYFTQHHPIEKIQKVYHQFFKRVEDVLDECGNITLLTNNADAVKETIPADFVLEEETTIWMGKDAYSLLVIEFSEEYIAKAEKEAEESDEIDSDTTSKA